MSEKLGALLLRKGLINKEDLEEGLNSQRIYGGRLGTNLIEVGCIDIEALSKHLGEQRGYPVATAADLEAVTSPTLKLVSADLSAKHQAVPLSLEGRRLKVAMAAPYDPQHSDGLGFALGVRLVPFIVPELRLFYEQERRYGLKREARYIRLEGDVANLPPGVARERRRFAPKVVTRPEAIGDEISLEQMFGSSPPPAGLAAPVADPYAAAATEGAVAKVLVAFCTSRFRRVFLFGERDGAAGVSRAKGDGAERPQARAIRVDLAQPSCLNAAAQAKAPQVVSAPKGPLDVALFAALAEPGWTMVVASIRRAPPNRAFVAVLSEKPPDAKLQGEFSSMVSRAEATLAKLGIS